MWRWGIFPVWWWLGTRSGCGCEMWAEVVCVARDWLGVYEMDSNPSEFEKLKSVGRWQYRLQAEYEFGGSRRAQNAEKKFGKIAPTSETIESECWGMPLTGMLGFLWVLSWETMITGKHYSVIWKRIYSVVSSQTNLAFVCRETK